jgi:hypothetical protein
MKSNEQKTIRYTGHFFTKFGKCFRMYEFFGTATWLGRDRMWCYPDLLTISTFSILSPRATSKIFLDSHGCVEIPTDIRIEESAVTRERLEELIQLFGDCGDHAEWVNELRKQLAIHFSPNSVKFILSLDDATPETSPSPITDETICTRSVRHD